MTKAEADAKRADRAAAKQLRLEERLDRDWGRAIREDRQRTIDRFCRRELGMSLEDTIEAVRHGNGAAVKGGYKR